MGLILGMIIIYVFHLILILILFGALLVLLKILLASSGMRVQIHIHGMITTYAWLLLQQHHGQKISNGVVLESPMDMIVFRLQKVLTLIHGMITISAGKIM